MTKYLLLSVVFSLLAIPAHGADTLYVNGIAEPGGDGQSWIAPYRTIGAAKDVAVAGDEIWVAQGVYEIESDENVSELQIANGVNMYGGFRGNEVLRELRDWFRQPTRIRAEFQTKLFDLDSSTSFNGLIFEGPTGGIEFNRGSVRFINCRFTGIRSGKPALRLRFAGRVRIEYCVFDNNNGGALSVGSTAVSPDDFTVYIGQTLFQLNTHHPTGGGVTCSGTGRIQFSSCVFAGNVGTEGGGAISSIDNRLYITNCTFIGNKYLAEDGNGLSIYSSRAEIQNSIFWNGDISDDQKQIHLDIRAQGDTITTIACLVERDFDYGYWQSNPQLVDIDDVLGPDGFFGTDDDGYHLSSISQQIDGGIIDPFVNKQNTDAIGNPRLVGRKIDAGAYETQRKGRKNPLEVMEELREGKLVVFMRHAATDWDQQDPGPSPECFPGRNLGPQGREQSQVMGRHIVAQGVPVGDANSSPVCRCWETLDIMFGHYEKKSHWTGGGSDEEMDARFEEIQTEPTNGCRFISTHDRIANMVFNPDGGGTIMTTAELMEGDALIIRPLGDDYLVLAHWSSDTWERFHVRFPSDLVSVHEDVSELSRELSIQPNPADDVLTIVVDGSQDVTIMDIVGRQVWSGNVDQRATVNLSALGSGMYFVRTSNGSTKKLVIQ